MKPLFSKRSGKQRWFASTAALVLFVLLMVGLVIGMDALEHRRALRMDLSFNGITTQGDATNRILLGLTKPVHVYALYSPGQEDKQLIGLLERYAAKSPMFSFSVENLARNPRLLTSISSSLEDAPVGNDSLIVHCPETDRTRILTGGDFIAQGFDMQSDAFYAAGLNYERSLTEAVLYVSSERTPTLQILSGHGELAQADLVDMEALLKRFNYDLRYVQLLRGDTLDPLSPLMILSPQKDITEAELHQLDRFSRAGGSVFITWDYDTSQSLPNLQAFYRGLGFVRRPGLVVAQDDAPESYYNYPAILVPYMQSTEPTASLVDAKQTMIIMPGAVSFEEPDELGSDLIWQSVLMSGPAYIREGDDIAEDLSQRPEDETGTFILAMLSNRAYEDGTRSRAFIAGSSGPFVDGWMHANTYGAELLLNVVDYLDPADPISLSIDAKTAFRPPLNPTTPWLTNLLLLLPPGIVLLAALIILLPRRRL